ncbi:TPA: hypothetical protein ACYUQH_002599 [Klebsiella pneumoniae]|uniref:hypothetical protein n=1 Tax=Klebsiella pneumoniae TaxID=573 RepID=UPI001C93AA80|nr:hypothetical protein [Klebsiella pneumoniae]MBY5153850.1 hypothetical protein [Klebsiella pneumoniae]MBZ7543915.1 hypothetical protein [Klebsiella pneumoniae]HBQ5307964.1 hypothetical protein [Klebsiella pneumoniae]HBQ5447784.1 hypothetical protein [Klebsiella pneumoniae]HBS9221230.1 hypothetical protein [Klebsiella pneumoniae]
MALNAFTNSPLTIKDVVSHEITPFSRRVINVALKQRVQPGSVITSTGELVGSGATSAYVVLEYASASSTAVPVLVAGTNVWLKKFALQCNDVDKAVELLSADPAVRFSDAATLPTT